MEVEKYDELVSELKNWLRKTDAEICTLPNPEYDEAYTEEKYDRIVFIK